jgi:hypothetical protein
MESTLANMSHAANSKSWESMQNSDMPHMIDLLIELKQVK